MTTKEPKIEISLTEAENLFNALSDQNRLRILYLLHKLIYILSVDVEKIFGFSNTKANRHLRYLKNSGLLLSEKFDQYVIHVPVPKYPLLLSPIMDNIKDPQLNEDLKNYKRLFKEGSLSMRKWFTDPGIKEIYEKIASE